ncbi:MAG: hypothetical protein ACJ798_11905 [Phenylobacterium sp.]
MRTPERQPADPAVQAAVDALLAARWECADLLSRKPAVHAIELVSGRAAELASSPIGRDQMLSAALDAAAADLGAGRPPLPDGTGFFFRGRAPCPTARLVIREQVFRHPGVPGRAADEAAAELERRCRLECRSERELSARLWSEASLQRSLWDDPRLPAQTHTRLIMLCAVPKLARRAADLDPSHARVARRRDSARGRRARSLVVLPPRGRRTAGSWPLRWPVLGWLAASIALAGAASWALIDP